MESVSNTWADEMMSFRNTDQIISILFDQWNADIRYGEPLVQSLYTT